MICLLRLLFIIYSTLLGFFPLLLSYLGTLSSPFFLDLHISLVTYVVHRILRRLTLHNTRFCLCSRLRPFTWTRIHSPTASFHISSFTFMLTAFVMSVHQSTIALPSISGPSLKTLLRIRSIHPGIAIQSPSSRLLNQKPKMYYFPLGHPHSCAIQYPILILSTYRLSSTPLSSLVFSLSLYTTSTFCT